MKKLVSLLGLTMVVGAMATVPAMAQGSYPAKQQPTKQQPKTTVTSHKQVSDTINKGQTGAKHMSMTADTSRKGQMAARHTRRHHRKSVSKTSSKKVVTKKPAPKSPEK